MKLIILNLVLISLLASCVSSTTPEAAKATGKTGSTTGGTTVQTLTAPKVRVKNYNQYNMTLAKLTGLNSANYHTLFESLKGSLPADNEIEGMTPFNLIAMTRLADTYCGDFINREATVGLAGDLNPIVPADVSAFLFSRFLDADPNDRRFDSLRTEVANVLDNDDGTGQVLLPGASNNLAGYKSLAVAACVTILASPYITLLE